MPMNSTRMDVKSKACALSLCSLDFIKIKKDLVQHSN